MITFGGRLSKHFYTWDLKSFNKMVLMDISWTNRADSISNNTYKIESRSVYELAFYRHTHKAGHTLRRHMQHIARFRRKKQT